MSMFKNFAGIPSTITGFRKLKAAVKAGEVRNEDAKAALRALADARVNAGPETRIGRALAECEDGSWKPGEEAPAKAPAKGKARAKATGEARLFADLSGLERHRALKAEAERLGLDTSGKSAVLEARILAGVPAKARARKSKAKAVAPDAAAIAAIATEAALAAVAAWVKANA